MFYTYQKFNTEAELNEVVAILKEHKISYETEQESQILADHIIGSAQPPRYVLKISEKDFVIVNDLVANNYAIDLNEIEKDYYLFSFTDIELMAIVNSVNEWGMYDKAVAKKILEEKGVGITLEEDILISVEKQEPYRINEVALIFEYLASVMFSYVGAIIGIFTLIAYRTTPHGKQIKMFDEYSRKHGKIILAIGIIHILFQGYLIWKANTIE